MISPKPKPMWDIREIIEQDIYRIRNIKPPDYIIDIGANIGIFSILSRILYPKAIIDAYEPSSAFSYLFSNTDMLNINIFNIALGNGEITKQIMNNYQSGWDCKSVPLNKMLDRVPLQSRLLVKCDVEGGECVILDNIEMQNAARRIDHFVMELHYFGKRTGFLPPIRDFKEYEKWLKSYENTHMITFYKGRHKMGSGYVELVKK